MSELGFVVGGGGLVRRMGVSFFGFWYGGEVSGAIGCRFFWIGWFGGRGGGVNPYFLIEMNVEAYQHVCSHDINVQSNITTSRA